MKVSIEYHDTESLTIEEVVRQAQQNYGNSVKVEVTPDSTIAYDHIYFGIWQLVTHRQASLMFDKKSDYQTDLKSLRADVQFKLDEILSQVIIDNENRLV